MPCTYSTTLADRLALTSLYCAMTSGIFFQSRICTSTATGTVARVTSAMRQSNQNRAMALASGRATAAALSFRWCAMNSSRRSTSSRSTLLVASALCFVIQPSGSRVSLAATFSRRSSRMSKAARCATTPLATSSSQRSPIASAPQPRIGQSAEAATRSCPINIRTA